MLRVLALCLVLVAGRVHGTELRYDCVLEASKLVRVGSSVSGLLEEVMVERGEFVEENQVLARLKSSVNEAIVEIFRVQATNATRIGAQEARVAFVRKRAERAESLWKKQMIPTDSYDEILSELTLAESELAREKLEFRIAQLDYKRSKLVLEGSTIRSPTSGIVQQQLLSAGEFMREDGYVLTLAKLDPLHVEVFLPVEFFPQIRVGMMGVVEPAAPVNGRYFARVKVVDRVFDAASGSFGVRLSLPNKDGALPAGHRCEVTFVAEDLRAANGR